MLTRSSAYAAQRPAAPARVPRSLVFSAVRTGLSAAAVCAAVAIVAVAICWLPTAGTTDRVSSTIRAGLLTYLASLHGGITVAGMNSAFVPLGLTAVVALIAWRAGLALAEVAKSLNERDPFRLLQAALVQSLTFMAAAVLAVPFSSLGTSRAPLLPVGFAALLLFSATGSVAFIRSRIQWSAVSALSLGRGFGRLERWGRGALAAALVYLGAGAALVAISLVIHHGRVESLSRSIGGGWGSLPILLLGVMAVPNAVIAGAAYLAGPGFAVAVGSTASVGSAPHGALPAFPLLGALPDGTDSTLMYGFVVATAVLGGLALSVIAARAGNWRGRVAGALGGAMMAGLIMAVLAWLGGGGIGDGHLRTMGAPVLWLGLVVAVETGASALLALAAFALWSRSHLVGIGALAKLRVRLGGPRLAALPASVGGWRSALRCIGLPMVRRSHSADTDADTDTDGANKPTLVRVLSPVDERDEQDEAAG